MLHCTVNLPFIKREIPLDFTSDIIAVAGRTGHSWKTTGPAPCLGFRNKLLVPGMYMLEINIEFHEFVGGLKIVQDAAHDARQETYLILKNSRVSKRMLMVKRPLASMSLYLDDASGAFSIHHLRLAWLTPSFAKDCLYRRLANHNHNFRGKEAAAIQDAIAKKAQEDNASWNSVALQLYNQTFMRLTIEKDYPRWLQLYYEQNTLDREVVKKAISEMQNALQIAIMLHACNDDFKHVQEAMASVQKQSYPHWHLCIAVDADQAESLRSMLAEQFSSLEKVSIIPVCCSESVVHALNMLLERAAGGIVTWITAASSLDPDALFHAARAFDETPKLKILYSDEDRIGADGQRHGPELKPSFNEDLLLSTYYIGNPLFLKVELVQNLEGFNSGTDGAHFYDLLLRSLSLISPDEVQHLPKILHHERRLEQAAVQSSSARPDADAAGMQILQQHIERNNFKAAVQPGPAPGSYRIAWRLPEPPPLVSLIIPSRDNPGCLQTCVEGVLEHTSYSNCEIIVLNNQSREPEALHCLQELAARERVSVHDYDKPFNYSSINNFGVSLAKGELLAFVNDDIEPINPDWLTEMVSQACRPEIGCVGAKLLYPNNTVQHGGVVLGLGGVAGHSHKYFAADAPGYMHRLQLVQNYSAVTAACLLVRKSVFLQAGGFNEEHLQVAFNDVDLCLKVHALGYRNLWTPYALLYHHESLSRGADDTPEKKLRARKEMDYLRNAWWRILDNDPAYNPNLTHSLEDFSLYNWTPSIMHHL